MNLVITFLDFNSIERCLVLDLDSKYDLILGMACLERHEPWIDWGSKTLGATRNVSSEVLESHETTFGRQQKHYWREPLTDDVNVLDIGMPELTNSNADNMNSERSSLSISDTESTPLSVTRCDNESLHVESMVGSGPSYQECYSFDVCVVARENAPSAVGREGTTLNVGNDIVGETPVSSGLGPYSVSGVALLNSLGEVFELRNTSPDVDQDISSRVERTTSSSNHVDTIVPTTEGCKVSLKR